jgi:hypothetical protein
MLAVSSCGEGGGRDAYAIPVARLTDAWPDVLGALTLPECPYRGLGAYTADDAEAGVFVGREEEVGQLREMVRKQPLVVVTGPSGVGKSSLVNAGLVPNLHDEGWLASIVRPGGMPFDALAEVLLKIEQGDRAPTVDELTKWADRLRSGEFVALGSKLSLLVGKPIMMCVDQLEQVLDPGICPSAASAEFLDLLLQLQPVDRLRVVCTLRADFLSQLLEHPDAGARLRDRLFTLSPMSLCMRWRLVRTVPGWRLAVMMAVREWSMPPLTLSCSDWTMVTACTRWCLARMAPSSPLAAGMVLRGWQTPPPAPNYST